MEDLFQYYHRQDEPNQSCLLALRDLILAQDPLVSETRKWNLPCFCYRKKMFCFLNLDKKTGKPYLLVVEGHRLEFPGLEAGDRTRMKVFRVNPEQDLPVAAIKDLLQMALDLYRTGAISPGK